MLELDKYEGAGAALLGQMLDEAEPANVDARERQKRKERSDRRKAKKEIANTAAFLTGKYPDPEFPDSTKPITGAHHDHVLELRLRRISKKEEYPTWDITTDRTAILGIYPDGRQEVLFEIEEVFDRYNLNTDHVKFGGSAVARNRDGGIATTDQYLRTLSAVRVIAAELPRQYPQTSQSA